MQIATFVTLAVTGLAGLGSASSHGMLKSCDQFSLSSLDSPNGGPATLSAWCTHKGENVFSSLDLNKCFGWSSDSCGFTYPPASGFTGQVSSCSNTHSGDSDFGNNFGCKGPCNQGSGDVFNTIALNSYIGNNNGQLTC